MSDEINVVNKLTGEVLAFPSKNDGELALSYAHITELEGALRRAKEKIKAKVLDRMNGEELSAGGYTFKLVPVQYKNYDLTTLRGIVDEDLFSELVKPDKKKIDDLIKEGVQRPESAAIPPEQGSILRNTMVQDRAPSVSLKLSRDLV